MLTAITTSPATYFLALISLSAVLPRLGRRAWRMGPMALTAIAMYVVSTGIVTSYHHVPENMQVAWWGASLFIVGLAYLAILITRGLSLFLIAFALAWLIVTFVGGIADTTDLARKAFWFLQFSGIATLAFLCFLTVAKEDLIGQLTWGILFIAEWISAFQIVDCQFLHGMAFTIVRGSACEAVYGSPVAPFVPMVLPTLVMAWILFRWSRPRRG